MKANGLWVTAGDLQIGDQVRQADGSYGVVEAMTLVEQPQWMYNLTVAEAHTYFVGEGRWLVHNICGSVQQLSNGEIRKLKKAGIDIHDLKGKKGASRRDLFKDDNGDIYVAQKGGKGEFEFTGYNINNFGH